MASLICGIAGNLCLGPLTGIPAIILGHKAYGRARREPAVFGGAGLALAGLILGYVSLVVGLAVTAVMLGLTLPALANAKAKATEIKCLNNLKMVGLSARIYATDHDGQFPPDFLSMKEALGSPTVLRCPGDQRMRVNVGGGWEQVTADTISYQMLQPGAKEDAVLGEPVFRCPIHGHTVLGDGSVQRGHPAR